MLIFPLGITSAQNTDMLASEWKSFYARISDTHILNDPVSFHVLRTDFQQQIDLFTSSEYYQFLASDFSGIHVLFSRLEFVLANLEMIVSSPGFTPSKAYTATSTINLLLSEYLEYRLLYTERITRHYLGVLFLFSVMSVIALALVVLFRRQIVLSERSAEYTAQFARQIINAQETERVAIARELHDTVAQDLLSIRLMSETLSKTIARSGSEYTDSFQMLIEHESSCIERIRQVCQSLRPPELEHLDIRAAISELCLKFRQTTGVTCHFLVSGSFVLEGEYAINCYRIIQESLNNIRKHSGATEILVQLTRIRSERLMILVEDNGKGIQRKKLDEDTPGSYGIRGIMERVQLMNGTVSIEPRKEHGTAVWIIIPLTEKDTPVKIRS